MQKSESYHELKYEAFTFLMKHIMSSDLVSSITLMWIPMSQFVLIVLFYTLTISPGYFMAVNNFEFIT